MISAIIKQAGGPKAISEASRGTRKPISIWAVHKWRAGGIPSEHWDMLMRLNSKITVTDLYAANRSLTASRPHQGAEGNAVAA